MSPLALAIVYRCHSLGFSVYRICTRFHFLPFLSGCSLLFVTECFSVFYAHTFLCLFWSFHSVCSVTLNIPSEALAPFFVALVLSGVFNQWLRAVSSCTASPFLFTRWGCCTSSQGGAASSSASPSDALPKVGLPGVLWFCKLRKAQAGLPARSTLAPWASFLTDLSTICLP